MLIGIFDSGIGGKAIADTLREIIPMAELLTVNDHKNVPYGDRETEDIIRLTKLAIQPLLKAKCDVIVIACNTATTIAISRLRIAYPGQHFVGIEPMIKPAALITKTRRIAVCATPSTLKSDRYQELKRIWAKQIIVVEPDCSDWALLIEQGKSNTIDVDFLMKTLLVKKVDVIVLGCTHFHWLKQRILDTAPNMTVLEPSDSIAGRVKSLLRLTGY